MDTRELATDALSTLSRVFPPLYVYRYLLPDDTTTRSQFSPDCLALVQRSAREQARPQVFAYPTEERLARYRYEQVSNELVLCEAEHGNVGSVLFTDRGGAFATLLDGTMFEFDVPDGEGQFLAARLATAGVQLRTVTTPDLDLTTAPAAPPPQTGPNLPVLALGATLLAAVVFALVRRSRKRRTGAKVHASAATSAARRSAPSNEDVPTTRFSDVAGCAEAVEDLREMVDVLTNDTDYRAVGARAPKGALLVGPPGTGKTLLARAVAGEAGVPFFSVAGSDFVEMYVGVGAKRVREVFARARKAGKAIVFIDEVDAVGRRRSDRAVTGGDQETENTLIALLNELDGFTDSRVMVLAATNRPDVLDPALLRPGRLDRRVHVGLPDVKERAAILRVHARNKPLGDVSLEDLAARTPGMSGAQLEQVCNEAALLAARDRSAVLTQTHLDQAVEYVMMGRARRSATVPAELREVTAWHEAGHAVVALTHPHANPPVAISIVPRGQFGGVTWLRSEDTLPSRPQMQAHLAVALAGRVAEELLLAGDMTAGAADDLARASELARSMVDELGMSPRGLSVRHASTQDSLDAVEALLQDAHSTARGLLLAHRDLLEAVARALLAHDDLDRAAIESLAAQHLPV